MKLSSLLRKFSKDKKGSTAIGLGLTFTMVAGATIGAIEIEQMQKARNVLQDKLDATILYLGNSEYKTNPQDAGVRMFGSMVDATDLEFTQLVPTFTYDNATGNIIGDVSFEIPSLMAGGLIADKLIDIRSVATPKTKGTVEIAMVLDVSGSMAWEFDSTNDGDIGDRRIDGLFEASTALFNTIYTNPQAVPAVAVIPYATSVDITDQFAAAADKTGYKDAYGSRNLSNISMAYGSPSLANLSTSDVTERDHSNTMAVWATERYIQQNDDGTYKIGLAKPKSGRQIPVYTEESSELWMDNDGSKYKVSPYWNGYYYGGYERPTMGVMPMTTNTTAVRDYVSSFTPSGGTAGHIGMAWGLYALTPGWNGTFNHPAGKPAKFEETTEKYLVFMSDGQFNSQKDPEMDNDEMYEYFQSVCSKARAKGVRVFTVGLLLDDNTETQLQKCAGNTGAFYSVDTRLELVEAFKNVGRETGELRLSH